jgi:small GTP-binding protein
MTSKSRARVKTVVIGNSKVGKTCLLVRFIENVWLQDSKATIGTNSSSVSCETRGARPIELELMDTGGQEMYRSVTNSYFRNSMVGYFVFDLANRVSFEALDAWVAEFTENVGRSHISVLIGNKLDLSQASIPESEIRDFATKHKMKYFTCSAKTGDGVNEAMKSVLEDLDPLLEEEDHLPEKKADPVPQVSGDRTRLHCC